MGHFVGQNLKNYEFSFISRVCKVRKLFPILFFNTIGSIKDEFKIIEFFMQATQDFAIIVNLQDNFGLSDDVGLLIIKCDDI